LTFDELVASCKASVSLDVNGHRDCYESLGRYITNRDPDIDEELLQRLIAADCMYRLQFYPDTPVGFYVVYGTSLTDVLEQASKCFPK